MISAGHTCLAPEGPDGVDDALVVGGDQDVVDCLRAFGAFVDALDHGLASQGDKGLAGEARGGVARRNHHDDSRVAHN
jgi:hypothetical protein